MWPNGCGDNRCAARYFDFNKNMILFGTKYTLQSDAEQEIFTCLDKTLLSSYKKKIEKPESDGNYFEF